MEQNVIESCVNCNMLHPPPLLVTNPQNTTMQMTDGTVVFLQKCEIKCNETNVLRYVTILHVHSHSEIRCIKEAH